MAYNAAPLVRASRLDKSSCSLPNHINKTTVHGPSWNEERKIISKHIFFFSKRKRFFFFFAKAQEFFLSYHYLQLHTVECTRNRIDNFFGDGQMATR